MLDAFLKGLPENSFEIEWIDAYERMVMPCTHCGHCERQAGCFYRDMDEIHERITRADALLFASPVYNACFPAPMKAIIDRFQRYYAARVSLGHPSPLLRPKKAVLLTVSGSCDEDAPRHMQRVLARQFTVMNTTLSAAFHLPDTDRDGGLSPLSEAELAALARRLGED